MSDTCNLVENGQLLICKAHDKIAELRAENERLRRWVYATARSNPADAGLSLEEYNAITSDVVRVFE